jgi:hypothetical protein
VSSAFPERRSLACDVHGRAEAPPRWRACRPGFFLPVRVLGRLFRGKFLAGLRAAYDRGGLTCAGRMADLAEPAAFRAWLTPLYDQDWVVYARAPFGGPEQVLTYLARSTHRVAISNARRLSLEGGQVTFRYQDDADDRRCKRRTLSAEEFLRRFLQHVLPSGFVKVRHYGLLANRHRQARRRVCRALLLVVPAAALVAGARGGPGAVSPPPACPHCGGAVWRVVARVPRPTVAEVCRLPLAVIPPPDSS